MGNVSLKIPISQEERQQAENCLQSDGMSLEDALAFFVGQIIRHQGECLTGWIQWIPNEETIAAFEEAKRIAQDPNVKTFKSIEELKADLLSDDE